MSETERAWAAGFFDGEGSFNVSGNHRSMRLGASITQVDRRVLDRFRDVVQVGSIVGPYQRIGRKPQWMWQAFAHGDVEVVGKWLWPYLGPVKRDQFMEALAQYGLRPRGRGYGWNKGGHQSLEWVAKRIASRRNGS